jgi:hypothetical protein
MKFVDLSKLRSLEELIYENVKVITTEGKIYEGEFTSYTCAAENDDGLDVYAKLKRGQNQEKL